MNTTEQGWYICEHVKSCSEHDKSCFFMFHACSGYAPSLLRTWWNMPKHNKTWNLCSEHEIRVLNMKCMYWTWNSCSEHEIHVVNMTIMFRTWQEHDSHVQNMTVMFNIVIVMFWTWWSCSEHDGHVLNMMVMFWTWWSCS